MWNKKQLNMKNFLKTTLAVVVGTLIALFVSSFLFIGIIGSLASLGESTAPVVPAKAILRIDLESPVTELGQEDAMQAFQSFNFSSSKPLGILKAVRAIENAASDPAIRFIYLNPGQMNIGMANLEEIRGALANFRKSGKPIITYVDNFSTASYYLASLSDKIYMNCDGMNSPVVGIGTSIMFFKDLLDKLGINVQLIRHGKFKAAAEQFISSGISKENYEQNKEMLDSIWETWTNEICESRGISPAQFNSLVDNLQLFSAKSFKENNLVDELVTRDELYGILCNLFGAKRDRDLKFISLSSYAEATVKPNIKVREKIAVIYADGEITMDDPNGLSVKKFYPIIREVGQDSSIKAVVLRVNSPGGDAQAAEILNKELQLLRAKKPLIISMGEYAASGGYWIAANSDKIFADNTTITGSIGVFSMAMNYGEGLKKHLKVNAVEIGTNAHSTMLTGINELDSKEIAFMQGMVEEIYTQFTDLVSEGRNLPVEYVDEVGQGRVWTGADAISNRLADEKGGIADAINYAAAAANLADYRIAEYPALKTPMEQFMEMLQGAEATVKAVADPQETIMRIYSNMESDGQFRIYARHPYCYEFKY